MISKQFLLGRMAIGQPSGLALEAGFASGIASGGTCPHGEFQAGDYATYKKQVEDLVLRACARRRDHALNALNELCSLLRSCNRAFLDCRPSIEDTPANKIKGSMKDLFAKDRPFQACFNASMELCEVDLPDTSSNRWCFSSLSFFHDRHLPVTTVLAAEGLSIITRRASLPMVARASFDALCSLLAECSITSRLEQPASEHVAIACARAIALLAIDSGSLPEPVTTAAVVTLLATFASNTESAASLAARDGLKLLVFENARLFRVRSCLQPLVAAAEEKTESRAFFFNLFMYLAVNDLDAFRQNPELFERLERLCTQDSEQLWKHFMYYAVPLRAKPGDGARQRIVDLVDTGECECLFVHNIREGLGDEWIRHGQFLQSLLELNSQLSVTILTDRPWLYNHSRVNTLPIESEAVLESIKDRDYALVVNEYYLSGAHSESVQNWVVQQLRNRVPIYLETAAQSNYYCPGYAFVSRLGQRLELVTESLPDNVYGSFFHLAAELGLPAASALPLSVLFGRTEPAAQQWINDYILANPHAAGRKLLLYNPFGGTYERKGYTRTELSLAVDAVLKAIHDGFFVIIPPSASTSWSTPEVANEIREQLPPSDREFCIVALPPEKNPHLHMNLLAMVDKIASMEGGLAHLACCTGKPVDIILKRDAKQPAWLPVKRAHGQRETTLLEAPSWCRA